jgi:hypothetical protein
MESSVRESMSLDDQLRELVCLFEKCLNHETAEVYQLATDRSEDHFYVHMICGLFRGIEGVLSMDKQVLENALTMLKKAASACHMHRKKTSWFFRPDYNSFSDGKCQVIHFMDTTITFHSSCPQSKLTRNWLMLT